MSQPLGVDALSIETRDRPARPQSDDTNPSGGVDHPGMKRIADRCRVIGKFTFLATTLQEEQERELFPEIGQERQVQGAPFADPDDHQVRRDVCTFAITAEMERGLGRL